jgi:hypothetical protein
MATVSPAPTHACPSGKQSHPDQRSAAVVARKRSRTAGPLRIYPCPDCGRWHLTSRNPYGRYAVGKRSAVLEPMDDEEPAGWMPGDGEEGVA